MIPQRSPPRPAVELTRPHVGAARPARRRRRRRPRCTLPGQHDGAHSHSHSHSHSLGGRRPLRRGVNGTSHSALHLPKMATGRFRQRRRGSTGARSKTCASSTQAPSWLPAPALQQAPRPTRRSRFGASPLKEKGEGEGGCPPVREPLRRARPNLEPNLEPPRCRLWKGRSSALPPPPSQAPSTPRSRAVAGAPTEQQQRRRCERWP